MFLYLQLEFRLGFKANVILGFRVLGTQSANDGPHKDRSINVCKCCIWAN